MKRLMGIIVLWAVPSMASGLEFKQLDLNAGGAIQTVRVVDLNGDGSKDLVVSVSQMDATSKRRKLAVFFARDQGLFPETPTVSMTVPEETCLFDMADMEGDGRQEILLVDRLKTVSHTPSPDGFGKSVPILDQGCELFFPDEEGLPYYDLVRNWRGDETAELLLPGYGQMTLFEKGKEGYRRAESLPVGMKSRMRGVQTGYEGSAAYSFQASIKIPVLALSDFDGDADPDLYVMTGEEVSVFLQTEGRFEKKAAYHHVYKMRTPEEMKYRNMGVGAQVKDIDRDGYGDLILTKFGGSLTNYVSRVWVYKGEENGLAAEPIFDLSTKGFSGSLVLSDADGDGHLDLVLPSVNVHIFTIIKLLLTKRLTVKYKLYAFDETKCFEDAPGFSLQTTYVLEDSKYNRIYGFAPQFGHDFDGDGRPDVLSSAGTDELGIFPGEKGTSFSGEPATTLSVPATPFLTVLDLNGDKRSDLLLWYAEPEKEGQIRIYLNGL